MGLCESGLGLDAWFFGVLVPVVVVVGPTYYRDKCLLCACA